MRQRGLLVTRRRFVALGSSALATGLARPVRAAPGTAVERWGVFDLALRGPTAGNPFTDVRLAARFQRGARTVTVDGFYDGDGTYRVRFMPDEVGEWTFSTESNVPALAGRRGRLIATAPGPGNHGPVRVRDRFHFAHADGTPHYPIGTTAYAWIHMPAARQEETLRTLAAAPFNKLRMLIFPKRYAYVREEPPIHPYARDAAGRFDYLRPNPLFYRSLERRVRELGKLGIEADLILFHPYDEGHWGFDRMSPEANELYLRYVLARLGAFRNVWWSLANEYDLVKTKKVEDWNRYLDLVARHDPYGHLCSIHNGEIDRHFDHRRAPITHASVQHPDVANMEAWRARWGKPVIDDECEYEGDLEQPWGNITAEELVHRFWVGTVRGGYVGHGETYQHPEDLIWWAKGGVLRGKSAPRIAFLRRLLEAHGPCEPLDGSWMWRRYAAARQGDAVLLYLGPHQPAKLGGATLSQVRRELAARDARFEAAEFRVEVLDTWNMQREQIPGTIGRGAQIDLPARPWLALRLVPVV